MDEPRKVPFGEITRKVEASGARRATVEYARDARHEEWHEDGCRGFVLLGGVEYEFDDGRPPGAAEEEASLPPAPPGDGAPRGQNLAPQPTRLSLIDDPLEV